MIINKICKKTTDCVKNTIGRFHNLFGTCGKILFLYIGHR